MSENVEREIEQLKRQLVSENFHQDARGNMLARLRWLLKLSGNIAFLHKLKTRQGTIMPDFNALYRRKSELDRKIRADDHSA